MDGWLAGWPNIVVGGYCCCWGFCIIAWLVEQKFWGRPPSPPRRFVPFHSHTSTVTTDHRHPQPQSSMLHKARAAIVRPSTRLLFSSPTRPLPLPSLLFVGSGRRFVASRCAELGGGRSGSAAMNMFTRFFPPHSAENAVLLPSPIFGRILCKWSSSSGAAFLGWLVRARGSE